MAITIREIDKHLGQRVQMVDKLGGHGVVELVERQRSYVIYLVAGDWQPDKIHRADIESIKRVR